MSFVVDQFLQVKCKFLLTSETESSESIHSNNERVRLCTSVDLDRNSALIVMICSNENGNNNIVAYYIERRIQTTLISPKTSKLDLDSPKSGGSKTSPTSNLTFAQLSTMASQQQQTTTTTTTTTTSPRATTKTRTKPRIIIKQIYYHSYNEDIVAICLSELGNKLTLVSASSTIYIIPIKNILLNLHAKQLRSSQGKSMYFYDASILDCCTLDNPMAVAYWECSDEESKSTIVVANEKGAISFINVKENKQVNETCISEHIKSMQIIKDRFSTSLLINTGSFRQYRFALELSKQQQDINPSSAISPYPFYNDEFTYFEKDIMPPWDRRPIQIKLNSSSPFKNSTGPISVIHRVLTPSIRSSGSQSNLFSGAITRERSLPMVFYHPPNMISVIDVLGIPKSSSQASNNRMQASHEPRLLRFFSNKHFYYHPQKPLFVFKLTCLDPDEMITHVVLTDRFLAIATDRDRCLINSRNCCVLKNSSSHTMELDPLVKGITFSNEEKILLLLKSPVSNDQDGIIESFLLVTNKSIYSIEARQSCRDMFMNLIDSHLGIKSSSRYKNKRREKKIAQGLSKLNLNQLELVGEDSSQSRGSVANQMVINFLCHRDEVYERISYDSRAFSVLFKIELNSLYEAYGDKLLLRNQFDLAHRFFQMAKFDHIRTLGKYIRIGACARLNTLTLQQKQSIEDMFVQLLNACLDESTEDSCRLWYIYINFFLNYVGTIEELETNILNLLVGNSCGCRLVVTLYMAIGKDENESTKLSYLENITDNPLGSMDKLYNLSELFKNEFLMKLLERTLDLIPKSADLKALSDFCLLFLWR